MFAPTVYSWFVWLSEQVLIVYARSINSMALIQEAEFVYCAVGAESLNTMQVNLRLNSATLCINTSLPNRIYSSFLNHGWTSEIRRNFLTSWGNCFTNWKYTKI